MKKNLCRVVSLAGLVLGAAACGHSAMAQDTQGPADEPRFDQTVSASANVSVGEPGPVAMEAPPPGAQPPIPPYAEAPPQQVAQGGYCYIGPHPADTRVTPGQSWDPTEGQHIRPYPPVDTRLFAFNNGCYQFIGDPTDFGYTGQTYAYYGAHPVLDVHGGGWCFMIGGHSHWWRPWSPYFTVMGPWNYWYGPYDDPFFWSYWPYYSFYYRSYYPHYYAGGRYYRGGFAHAPAIQSVPRPSGGGWRALPARPASDTRWRSLASPSAGVGGGWRSGSGGAFRSGPSSGSWGSSAPSSGGGWRSSSPSSSGGSFRAPSSSGGGWRASSGGGGFRSSPSRGGGWRR